LSLLYEYTEQPLLPVTITRNKYIYGPHTEVCLYGRWNCKNHYALRG